MLKSSLQKCISRSINTTTKASSRCIPNAIMASSHQSRGFGVMRLSSGMASRWRHSHVTTSSSSSRQNASLVPRYQQASRYSTTNSGNENEREIDPSPHSRLMDPQFYDMLQQENQLETVLQEEFSEEKEETLHFAVYRNQRLLENPHIRELILTKWAPHNGKYVNYLAAHIARATNDQETFLSKIHECAEQNLPSALFELGTLYYSGLKDFQNDGVLLESNVNKAYEYFKRAAENGISAAHYNIFQFIKQNVPVDQLKDMSEKERDELATEHLEKAANSVEPLPLAQYAYGLQLANTQNYVKAFDFLKKAANNGEIDAMITTSKMVLYDPGMNETLFMEKLKEKKIEDPTLEERQQATREVTEEVQKLLQKAAMQGHPEALFLLGTIHEGIFWDVQRAFELYEQAAEKGYGKAYEKLADMWLHGRGTPQADAEKSTELLEKGAQLGDNDAAARHAANLVKGLGCPRDIETGRKTLEQLMEKNVAEAHYQMAELMNSGAFETEEGLSQSQREDKAMELMKKAADMNHAEALYKYGVFKFSRSTGVEDQKEAAEIFKRAAEMGSGSALRQLGDMLMQHDPASAFSVLKRAAICGELPSSLVSIGYMYEHGLAVKQDLEQARKLYKQASDMGKPEALTHFAIMMLNGTGGFKDVAKAINYMKEAIEKGDNRSLPFTTLGLAYMNGGEGVAADPKVAYEYFKQGAEVENPSPEAIHDYAMTYFHGVGVEIDQKKSVELLHKAAEGGAVNSQVILAGIYREGIEGVAEPDEEKSNEFAKQAAQNGFDWSQLVPEDKREEMRQRQAEFEKEMANADNEKKE